MSHTDGSSLVALIDLAKEPSSEKRRELLREITSVFMSNADEIGTKTLGLYDEVLTQLSEDMEAIVRAEIANTLADARQAPMGLLRKLASDHIDVAAPILTRSMALSESDLLHIVENQSQDHLRAVSQRETVSEAVSGVIVKRGDDKTLKTLLVNDGARLSREANEMVIHRAKANADLHEAVISRRSMPADLVSEMYFIVEARLRERIVAEHTDLDNSTLDSLLHKSRDKVAMVYGSYPSDFERINLEIEKMRAAKRLDPAQLARFMRDKNPTYFLCALSQLADLDYLTTKQLVEKREIDAIAIACKAAGLDKALFLTYVMIMLSSHENAMGRAAEYGELYSKLPMETATRTIRFWRLRRVEGRCAA